MFLSTLPTLIIACCMGGQEEATSVSLKGNTSTVYAIAFSPTGEFLASASLDDTIVIWNIKHKKQQTSFRWTAKSIRTVAFSPDGKTLAAGSPDDSTVKLWDIGTGKEKATIHDDEMHPRHLAFSPNGALLAFPSAHGAWLWDLHKERLDKHLKGHESVVNVLAFSPDGKIVATGSGDKYSGLQYKAEPAEVKLWDVGTGQELADLKKGIELRVDSLGFSTDGTKLLTYDHRTLKLWDVKKLSELVAVKGVWLQVAYSPNDKYIACLGLKEVNLVDPTTGKELKKIEIGRKPSCIAIAPDGKSFAVGYDRGGLEIWAVPEKLR